MTEKLKFVFGRVENIVGKGENAGYQHFLLFLQCFQDFFPGVVKSGDCVVKSYTLFKTSSSNMPSQGGSVVSVSDSWPGGYEFDPRLRQTFFPAYFRLSPLQKHVRKVVGGFGKKSFVSTGVRQPGNTSASPTTTI